MATLKCKLQFGKKDVKALVSESYCLASLLAVQVGDEEVYNVVSHKIRQISKNSTFKWDEKYCVALSDTTLEHGATIEFTTDQTPISPGQSITIPSAPSATLTPIDSPTAPRTGFTISNASTSSVVFSVDDGYGNQIPFYVSPPGPATDAVDIVPLKKLRVVISNDNPLEPGEFATLEGLAEVEGAVVGVEFEEGEEEAGVGFDDGTFT